MAQKKRNHFVPNWLLRRFACPDSKNRDQVWLLRANGEPFRTHINNAGSENYFYGEPANGLEDLLAKIDDRDSLVLAKVEQTDDLTPLGEPICRMVRLLLLRTRSLRTKFTDTAQDLVAMLEDSASDPEVEPLMRAHMRRIFDDEFKKAWAKQPPLVRKLVAKEHAPAMAREQAERLKLGPAISQMVGMVKDRIPWDETAERGHVGGLLKLLQQAEAEPIPERWRRLRWQVVKTPAGSLVLGDCAVIGFRDRLAIAAGAADDGHEPAGLCMPIAPGAFLFGATQGQDTPDDPHTINSASAAHSLDSLFASELTDEVRSLAPSLGSARGVLQPDDMASMRKSAWRDLDKDTRAG